MSHPNKEIFLTELFNQFYRENSSTINLPTGFENREFGFASFEGRMTRHKSFRNKNEFETFLEVFSPSDVYYSCAYYEDPTTEMDKKGWLGADLIFDIDADHIATPCDKFHDDWTCGVCGFLGKGSTPESCPACGGQKFSVKTWPCEICLNSAKTEAIKLLDFMTSDFGFSNDDVHVFFSGHRGYHIHVENNAVKTLESRERKEIVDYIYGLGLDLTLHGLTKKEPIFSSGLGRLRPDGVGWQGRLAKGLHELILTANPETYNKIGLPRNIVNTLTKKRNLILQSWTDRHSGKVIKGVGVETWERLIKFCVSLQSAHVDTVVTTDIHRLIRMAETLHSKTGFKKTKVLVSEIEGYDPFKSALAFKRGTVTVIVSEAPRFRVGEEIFGPYKDQKIELPTAVAVLLICRGRAGVLD